MMRNLVASIRAPSPPSRRSALIRSRRRTNDSARPVPPSRSVAPVERPTRKRDEQKVEDKRREGDADDSLPRAHVVPLKNDGDALKQVEEREPSDDPACKPGSPDQHTAAPIRMPPTTMLPSP